MTIHIANGAGFLGDQLDAPRRLVEGVELDYLTLEYLAELTLSILARQRQKDPQAGYARDFVAALETILPALQQQDRLRVVTNAGGVNPEACVRQAARLLTERGLPQLPIAMVTGDGLLDRLDEITAAGCDLAHLDTGQPLASVRSAVVSANAYVGAQPIAEALDGDAHIVITGRVADASLTVGPAVHAYGWSWKDWDRLAGASVAGHLIECGAQVTGGYTTRWRELELADVGYPIAELSENGDAVITKPQGTGGVVDSHSVVEQLVYEIEDPQHYLTPDVDVDFTAVEVQPWGKDRVRVFGAAGRPAPDSYKVSLAYHAGYQASGQLLIYGRDCVDKAEMCATIVRRRLEQAGYSDFQIHVEMLGAGHSAGTAVPADQQPRELVLRLTLQDPRREVVERFSRELVPLVTSGPAGVAGYTEARGAVRPVFAYWPALVPKSLVSPQVEVRAAKDWAKR